AGKRVEFLDMGGSLMINDAFIDTADIRASNGLIHAIDKVLTPPS
ncbi:MAG: fasciclin domain-containing protein, partial [Gammaproteobacteria bacterium]|nr:fasciclin domain-containing protein [Gammaproteobacteria bacterium]NIM72554.1 fasciclin domain-containing protein [Gammaproteobacteria bacterium]NIN37586.1 fasciclin domain-containing protein [Gammaproteobacteria bacterium]NIO24313.1 fasciclin domain-containing protein [Gammaproteobacteria bacterium]NIO64918.1 fasciclin domain-containing protein [Gammaproteobacteria bacterium]